MTVAVETRPDPAVDCRDVHFRFGDTVAVDGVDLRVDEGEVFGLLGPNGAGKTTLIRLINTLLPLREGSIGVFGIDVARRPMAVRRLLGYVPQQLSIEASLTGRENVMWFARLFDVPRAERRERVVQLTGGAALADRHRGPGKYRSGVEASLHLHDANTALPVAREDGTLDRRRSAPARQQ